VNDNDDDDDDEKRTGLTGSVRYVVKATVTAVKIDTDLTAAARVGVSRALVHV